MSVSPIETSTFKTEVQPRLKSNSSRLEYKFDELMARSGLEYVFLDYIFEMRGSNLHGAVTTTMRPVSCGEAQRKKNRYKRKDTSPLYWLYDEQSPKQSWSEWIQAKLSRQGLRLIYDPSYQGKYGEEVKQRASQECLMERSNIVFVECVGGGRMLNPDEKEYDRVYDDEMLRLAKEAERNGLDALY